MPKPKLDKETVLIQFKLTVAEKEAFERWCSSQGKTMSEVMRQRIEPFVRKGMNIKV